MLDVPVGDVLNNLGLPQLPQLSDIGLPDLSGLQMPTLPTIDPTVLIQPVVDLLNSIGTGISESGFDPTSILSGVADVLTSVISQSESSINKVTNTWIGDAATAARAQSEQVVGESAQVAAQGQQQKLIMLDASRIVAQGYAEVSGVIARFIANLTAGIAMLPTPAGIPWLIGIATDAIAEAGIIAAKTRVELSGKTVEMVSAGTKIMIAGAPIASNVNQLVNMVNAAVQPLTSIAPTVATKVIEKGATVVSAGSEVASEVVTQGQSVLSSVTSNLTEKTKTTDEEKTTEQTNDGTDDGTGGIGDDGSGTGGGGVVGAGMPTGTSSPLSQLASSRLPTESTGLGNGSPTGRSVSNVSNQATRASSPMMSPMGSAAGAARAGDAGGDAGADRPNLVTGAHGDEVVGLIEGVSIPVVGAAEPVDDLPDKALTL
ncbi:hypothetical protein [Nocardia sp. IFM 10818]